MDIGKLKHAVKSDHFKVTLHALQEKEFDNLTLAEIKQSVESSIIIEDYPDDKPYPSCLVLGFTVQKEPIHSVWAYDYTSGIAILITVYRPSPEKWVEYRKRK